MEKEKKCTRLHCLDGAKEQLLVDELCQQEVLQSLAGNLENYRVYRTYFSDSDWIVE